MENNHHVMFSVFSSRKRSKKATDGRLTHRACVISGHTAETWSMSWGRYLRWWLWDACPRCFQSGRFQLMVDSLGLRAGDGRSIWWRRGAFICFRWGAVTEGRGETERKERQTDRERREVWARPRRSCANQHRSLASFTSLLHCPDMWWRYVKPLQTFWEASSLSHFQPNTMK